METGLQQEGVVAYGTLGMQVAGVDIGLPPVEDEGRSVGTQTFRRRAALRAAVGRSRHVATDLRNRQKYHFTRLRSLGTQKTL